MKHDHPPVTPHGVAPHDHKHEHMVDMIEEHSAGGHVHHSKHSKEDCEAFGFLIVPGKYQPKEFVYKKDRQATQ